MNNFLKRLFKFALLFISLVTAIVVVNTYIIRKLRLVAQTKKNILVVGDSNTQCAINDVKWKNACNLSISAETYFYSYLKLRHTLKTSPQVDTVVLSFAPHNLFDNGWLFNTSNIYTKFKVYYPMMEREDFNYLYDHNPKAVLKGMPDILSISINNIIKTGIKRSLKSSYGDYMPLTRDLLKKVQEKLKKNEPLPFFKIPNSFKISDSELKYLHKIMELCKTHRVKLYLLNTPKRFEILEYPRYGVSTFNAYYDANFSDIDYIDCSRLELPENYYSDFVHLNKSGSEYFSMMIQQEGLSKMFQKYGRNKQSN